jgi:hypothetical protein
MRDVCVILFFDKNISGEVFAEQVANGGRKDNNAQCLMVCCHERQKFVSRALK